MIRKDFGAFEKKEFDSQAKIEKTALKLYSRDKSLAPNISPNIPRIWPDRRWRRDHPDDPRAFL